MVLTSLEYEKELQKIIKKIGNNEQTQDLLTEIKLLKKIEDL